jgi:hypothetical protein
MTKRPGRVTKRPGGGASAEASCALTSRRKAAMIIRLAEPQPDPEGESMSIDRRDFLKFGGLGALALAADPKELLGQDAGQIPNLAKQAKPITRE